jgi:integrase
VKSVRERTLITDPILRRFPAPAARESHFWDSRLRGFGVRVSATGSRTFVVLVASGRTKVIGRYPLISLQQARGEATRLLAEKALGKIAPSRTAFDDAKADYLGECESRLRSRTVRDYGQLLKLYYPFGRQSVSEITPRDILRNLNKLNKTPAEKHHAYAAGRTFFEWCLSQHLIDQNPMTHLGIKPTGNQRERVLNDRELKAVLKAALAGDTTFHKIVALLVLTGQRRTQISAAEWGWIGDDTITIPGSLTKNRKEHTFPIGKMTLGVLASITRQKDKPYLFPALKNRFKHKQATIFNSFSKGKAEFDTEVQIAHWTLHDLRRTFRTKWAELGVFDEVAEKYIHHISGKHSGVRRIYNRFTYDKPMRDATSLWEGHLKALLED